MEVRDTETLGQWWSAGALPRWATATFVLATIVTITVAHVGGRHLAAFLSVDRFWVGILVFALAMVALFAWVPRWRIARAARVAIVLPIAQIAAIAIGWIAWCSLKDHAAYKLQLGPLAQLAPLHALVPLYALATMLVARVIAGRRRSEWLHAAVAFGLVHALVAGVWVSIAAQMWCRGDRYEWVTWDAMRRVLSSPALVAFALVPPFLLATAFTAVAIRRYEWLRRHRIGVTSVTLLAITYASAQRLDPVGDSDLVYINFVHVLLALVAVAACSLGALAIASRRRRPDGQLHGTVAIESERGAPVAALQIAGWLRGPREIVRTFDVITNHGIVSVPAGVRVHAELPACSTHLASGEAIAVVREGDRVALSGYVAAAPDHPFRASLAPTPGPHAAVQPAIDEPRDVASVALALWRPCLAYLAVVVAIALVGLAAALSGR